MNNIEENFIWTEEKCIELIREYKSRPILWDSKDLLFYKNTARNEEWEFIGRALNIPPNDCKYKMNILMSSFRREKAKYKKGLMTDNPYVVTWFAFKELSFLMNRNTPKKRIINTEDDSNESNSSQIKVMPDTQIQLQNSKSQQLAIGHSPVTNEMILLQGDTNDYDIKLEIVSEAESDSEECSNQTTTPTPGPSRDKQTVKTFSVQTSTDPVNTEEIEAFTNFIKYKLMKYSEITLQAVQKEICDILFKADDGLMTMDENDLCDITEESAMNRRPSKKNPLKRKRESNRTIERMVFQDSDSSV
ncbi:uncharacterized protein LOC124535134 [Vanessa cardui]|uniref:uncharacterized protein LOC124535134 n=1 Tax=Vanessa cardui TaxID=171605 RepID=UPI001F135D70|nr:uncharacterized protein LOC124535134 [Vanessa cardui]